MTVLTNLRLWSCLKSLAGRRIGRIRAGSRISRGQKKANLKGSLADIAEEI